MSKRPSLLANLDMETGQGGKAPVSSVVEMPKAVKSAAVKTANIKTSLYLPPQANRKLKEIALAKECKVHDLVIAGIDKVLSENGFPTVEELGNK